MKKQNTKIDDNQNNDYFEDLEEKLLSDAEKREQKEMSVSGKSVFEIERLKKKRAEKK